MKGGRVCVMVMRMGSPRALRPSPPMVVVCLSRRRRAGEPELGRWRGLLLSLGSGQPALWSCDEAALRATLRNSNATARRARGLCDAGLRALFCAGSPIDRRTWLIVWGDLPRRVCFDGSMPLRRRGSGDARWQMRWLPRLLRRCTPSTRHPPRRWRLRQLPSTNRRRVPAEQQNLTPRVIPPPRP